MVVETEYRLDEFRDVIIGANGEGTVLGVGPTTPGERWVVERWSVTCTSAAQFRIVRGIQIDQRYSRDSTTRGDLDTSETTFPLLAGETVSFHWYDGTPGARATISWEGQRFVRGRRAYGV